MTQICELTKKSVLFGCRVSHAHNKTNRSFSPNLHSARLHSRLLNSGCSLRISTQALRRINRSGGIDSYMLNLPHRHAMSMLSPRARKLRQAIMKASMRQRHADDAGNSDGAETAQAG